jgi:hypothetical protein
MQLQKMAFAIDTIVTSNWEFQMGISHLLMGQYDEAIGRLNRGVEPPAPFFHAYVFLAWTYVELDRLNDANSAIKTVLAMIPHYTITHAAKLYAFRIDEVRGRLLECLRQAGMPE